MSSPLPLCAYCGCSLAHRGRMLATFGDLKGQPQVGWHTETCIVEDALCQKVPKTMESPSLAGEAMLLKEIHARNTHRSRIVYRGRMHEKGGSYAIYENGYREEWENEAGKTRRKGKVPK